MTGAVGRATARAASVVRLWLPLAVSLPLSGPGGQGQDRASDLRPVVTITPSHCYWIHDRLTRRSLTRSDAKLQAKSPNPDEVDATMLFHWLLTPSLPVLEH